MIYFSANREFYWKLRERKSEKGTVNFGAKLTNLLHLLFFNQLIISIPIYFHLFLTFLLILFPNLSLKELRLCFNALVDFVFRKCELDFSAFLWMIGINFVGGILPPVFNYLPLDLFWVRLMLWGHFEKMRVTAVCLFALFRHS